MVNNQQTAFLTYIPETLPPAQLFVGPYQQTLEAVEQLLQRLLCDNNSCNTCITCMRIRERQHHAIMWLHPEKNYTLDQLEDLFATLTFQLQTNEKFFFIVQKADFLPAACANKLLKPMEEPPAGYHFILLAEHPEQIVPTIKSRCIIHNINNTLSSNISHPLLEIFTQKLVESNEFSKILDTTTINERESLELFDQVLSYWLTIYHKEHDPKILATIQRLQNLQLQPPMPGSSVTFWRNVYMQFKDA